MKRKLFAATLVICMILSCLFPLSSCNMGDGGISESVWNSQLNLSNKNNISMTFFDGTLDVELKYNGTDYAHISRLPDSEVPSSEIRCIKEDDGYAVYERFFDGEWEKPEDGDRYFQYSILAIANYYWIDYSKLFKFNEFTYNSKSGAFEADEVVAVIEGFIDSFEMRYYDVAVTFDGNKLSTLHFVDKDQKEHFLTFSFDNVTVNSPKEDAPKGPITDESAWNNILDLTALDNVMVVQSRNDTVYSTFKWDGTNLYYEAEGVCILVVKEGDSYYTYTRMPNMAWSGKNEATEDTYNAYIYAYLANSEIYHYEDFMYSERLGKYVADSIDQTGDGVTVTINDVQIAFANDRPDTITYTHNGTLNVMTYTYEEVTIEIPNID